MTGGNFPLAGRVEVARFTVPGKPVPKGRPRVVRGHTFTPSDTVVAEEKVGWAFRAAARGVRPDRESEFGLEVTFYLPDRRRRDVDNLVKLVLDALNNLAYADDAQVAELHCRRVRASPDPRTEVTLYRITERLG